MAKGCALGSGYLPQGGLPRNNVDRITDRPNLTSAVDRGHKASTQTDKQNFIKWQKETFLISSRGQHANWLFNDQNRILSFQKVFHVLIEPRHEKTYIWQKNKDADQLRGSREAD